MTPAPVEPHGGHRELVDQRVVRQVDLRLLEGMVGSAPMDEHDDAQAIRNLRGAESTFVEASS
jgi:hypothetical protein